jgi:hypothetical protein
VAGNTSRTAFQNPSAPSPDRQHRRGHAASAAIAQQISPRLCGFAVAVGQGDKFLAAISTHPDHHQQAQFLLFEAHFEVDPVDP